MSHALVSDISVAIFVVLFGGGVLCVIIGVITRVLFLARIRKVDRGLFERLGGWRTLIPNGPKVSNLSDTTSLYRYLDDEAYLELRDRRARQLGIISARSARVAPVLVVLVLVAFIGLFVLNGYLNR